jgi:hypothetical protein
LAYTVITTAIKPNNMTNLVFIYQFVVITLFVVR